jgi:hypothetical protein
MSMDLRLSNGLLGAGVTGVGATQVLGVTAGTDSVLRVMKVSVAFTQGVANATNLAHVGSDLLQHPALGRMASPVGNYAFADGTVLEDRSGGGGIKLANIPYSIVPGSQTMLQHQYVAPTGEQVRAWSRDVFEYRGPDGKVYPAAKKAFAALKKALRVETAEEVDAIADRVLVQMAQFSREDRTRSVAGFTLPISSRAPGILVTQYDTPMKLRTLYIDPNTLSASTRGATDLGLDGYDLRLQLMAAVTDILKAGSTLVNTLETAEFGEEASRSGMEPKRISDAIHDFRTTLSNHQHAMVEHRYDAEGRTEEAIRMKTEVLVFAYALLGRNIPDKLNIDPMLIETIGNVLIARRGVFAQAKSAEHYEELREAEAEQARERAAEQARSAERELQARRSQALRDATLRGLRVKLSDYRMEGVQTEAADYFGASTPEQISVNGDIKDMDVVVRHYWWMALEQLKGGNPYSSVVRMVRPNGSIKPISIFLAAIIYYGGKSPDKIFVNGELVDDPRSVPNAWEVAVDSFHEGRRPARRVEMVGKDGQPVPFPPEIEALYSAS